MLSLTSTSALSRSAVARTSTRVRASADASSKPRAAPLDMTKSGPDFAKSLPGAIGPTGYLDVLNFAEGTSAEDMKRYREAELTHGRLAMYATVGFVVGEQVEGSSFLFDSQITGPAIGHFQQVEAIAPQFWEVLALVVAVAETTRVQRGWKDPTLGEGTFLLRDDFYPGDLSFDPFGLTPDTQEGFDLMQQKELSNGRLAMIGIAGMVAQELVDGQTLVGHFQASQ